MTEHVCRSCGSPLAADQRYCLQCGNRVAEARVPFLDILGSARPAVATTTSTVTERGSRWSIAHMSTNAAAVAGVACLLLALGVGVLIGNAHGSGNTAGQATPQVISVGGVAPSAAAPAPTTTAPDTSATTTTPAHAKAKKSSGASSAPAHNTKATNKALQNLSGTSGSDYQKKSSKLPKTLGTGGKAPPPDKKPAAGGGSFQSIG